MNYLWVVPCAGRNPPAGMTPSKGAHNTCRFESTGEPPPRGGQHRCSSLPCSLWVVPYAGRHPPTFGYWPDLRVQPVRRPRPTQWPAACAVLNTAPGENSCGACG